jgi:hypothetical protein
MKVLEVPQPSLQPLLRDQKQSHRLLVPSAAVIEDELRHHLDDDSEQLQVVASLAKGE